MTGLAAHMAAGDAPPDVQRVETMLAAMRHRGSDTACAPCGGAALGLRGRAGARRGFVRTRADGPALVGDIRLDDADDLADALGLSRAAPHAALALAAYERWDLAFVERLEGEFALLVWDPGPRRLVGARDRFGVKPFHYHTDRHGLTVASELGAVLAGLAERPRPDPVWIADYLAGFVSDAVRTAHDGVRRLEPGHILLWERGRVETRRYWRLEPRPPTGAADPAVLRELLADAVRRRTRDAPAGAMLSGGLDSSSLACLAAREAPPGGLPVFSLLFDGFPELDERRWIDAVLGAGRFAPTRLHATPPDALAAGRDALDANGEPLPAPGLLMTQALYAAAAAGGVELLVNGHGGDEVVCDGLARLPDLAATGSWRALWQACGSAAALYGDGRADLFLASVADGSGSRPARALARRLRRARARPDPFAWRRIVSPEAARRTGLVERRRAAVPAGDPDLDAVTRAHLGLLVAPRVSRHFEVLDRAAARHGVEPRYPFFDRRVVDHCLSRPAEEKLADGRTRALLRAAMDGLLPDAVRLRPGKAEFLPVALASLRGRGSLRLLDGLVADPGPLADHVAIDVLRGHLHALRAGTADGPMALELWRASQLALWLGAPAAARSEREVTRPNAAAAPARPGSTPIAPALGGTP